MKHTRAAAIIAALSAALLALAPSPASAGPPEIDHWTFSDSHIEQEEHEDFCVDEDGNEIVPFDVRWSEESHGTFRALFRQGTFFAGNTLRIETTFTNVENDKTFTIIWQGQELDQKVEWQEDGSMYLTKLYTGPTKHYDSTGKMILLDVGRTFVTIHLTADGGFIEDIGFDSKGQFDTADRDFCNDLVEFLS